MSYFNSLGYSADSFVASVNRDAERMAAEEPPELTESEKKKATKSADTIIETISALWDTFKHGGAQTPGPMTGKPGDVIPSDPDKLQPSYFNATNIKALAVTGLLGVGAFVVWRQTKPKRGRR
jgi:hypothetical protein